MTCAFLRKFLIPKNPFVEILNHFAGLSLQTVLSHLASCVFHSLPRSLGCPLAEYLMPWLYLKYLLAQIWTFALGMLALLDSAFVSGQQISSNNFSILSTAGVMSGQNETIL